MILPSRWDNFPTVLLEAMARSRPVVSSPNGGMPEMLEGTLCQAVDPSTPAFADEVAFNIGWHEKPLRSITTWRGGPRNLHSQVPDADSRRKMWSKLAA